MSRRKKPNTRRKRTFLPQPGQVLKDDPAGQMGVNVLVVILTALYEMTMVIAVPLWALIRYFCYDAWKK